MTNSSEQPGQNPSTGVSDPAPPPPPHPPAAPPVNAVPTPQFPPGYVGRRYGFLCSYCSSRLEATENLAGQSGTCPTCGNAIVIPILDYRGRLIDPTSGKVIKQDPHPVHAYAAAGHKAPQIISTDDGAKRHIQCPRCNQLNPLSGNNCVSCGLPFTMEGTMGDAISGTNTWAVASLVLGIVGLFSFCFFVPPLLAIIFGGVALRSSSSHGQQSGQGMAIAGIIMGGLGVVFFVIFMLQFL